MRQLRAGLTDITNSVTLETPDPSYASDQVQIKYTPEGLACEPVLEHSEHQARDPKELVEREHFDPMQMCVELGLD